MTLKGEKAPVFKLADNGDSQISFPGGKPAVLYFYPKDSTPGCTVEANDFSGLKDQFASENTIILGASKDSQKRHQNFINKQELTISLLSDESGKLCEDYGVWILKKMYGKEYMGIERATFLIDGDGVLQNMWRKVKVKGHAEAVLDAVKAL